MAWFDLNMSLEQMSSISDAAAQQLLIAATALAVNQPIVYQSLVEIVKKLVQEDPIKEEILVIARAKLIELGWTPK